MTALEKFLTISDKEQQEGDERKGPLSRTPGSGWRCVAEPSGVSPRDSRCSSTEPLGSMWRSLSGPEKTKLKRSSRREWNKMVPCRSHQVQSGGAAGRHQVNRESLVGDQVQSPWGQVGGVRCDRTLTVVRNFRHFCRSVQYGEKIFFEKFNLI